MPSSKRKKATEEEEVTQTNDTEGNKVGNEGSRLVKRVRQSKQKEGIPFTFEEAIVGLRNGTSQISSTIGPTKNTWILETARGILEPIKQSINTNQMAALLRKSPGDPRFDIQAILEKYVNDNDIEVISTITQGQWGDSNENPAKGYPIGEGAMASLVTCVVTKMVSDEERPLRQLCAQVFGLLDDDDKLNDLTSSQGFFDYEAAKAALKDLWAKKSSNCPEKIQADHAAQLALHPELADMLKEIITNKANIVVPVKELMDREGAVDTLHEIAKNAGCDVKKIHEVMCRSPYAAAFNAFVAKSTLDKMRMSAPQTTVDQMPPTFGDVINRYIIPSMQKNRLYEEKVKQCLGISADDMITECNAGCIDLRNTTLDEGAYRLLKRQRIETLKESDFDKTIGKVLANAQAEMNAYNQRTGKQETTIQWMELLQYTYDSMVHTFKDIIQTRYLPNGEIPQWDTTEGHVIQKKCIKADEIAHTIAGLILAEDVTYSSGMAAFGNKEVSKTDTMLGNLTPRINLSLDRVLSTERNDMAKEFTRAYERVPEIVTKLNSKFLYIFRFMDLKSETMITPIRKAILKAVYDSKAESLQKFPQNMVNDILFILCRASGNESAKTHTEFVQALSWANIGEVQAKTFICTTEQRESMDKFTFDGAPCIISDEEAEADFVCFWVTNAQEARGNDTDCVITGASSANAQSQVAGPANTNLANQGPVGTAEPVNQGPEEAVSPNADSVAPGSENQENTQIGHAIRESNTNEDSIDFKAKTAFLINYIELHMRKKEEYTEEDVKLVNDFITKEIAEVSGSMEKYCDFTSGSKDYTKASSYGYTLLKAMADHARLTDANKDHVLTFMPHGKRYQRGAEGKIAKIVSILYEEAKSKAQSQGLPGNVAAAEPPLPLGQGAPPAISEMQVEAQVSAGNAAAAEPPPPSGQEAPPANSEMQVEAQVSAGNAAAAEPPPPSGQEVSQAIPVTEQADLNLLADTALAGAQDQLGGDANTQQNEGGGGQSMEGEGAQVPDISVRALEQLLNQFGGETDHLAVADAYANAAMAALGLLASDPSSATESQDANGPTTQEFTDPT